MATSLTVTWGSPVVPNGIITSYELDMATGLSSTFISQFSGLGFSLQFSTLTAYTSYTFRVTACTSAGCTTSPVVSIQTLEAGVLSWGENRCSLSSIFFPFQLFTIH